MKISVKPGRTYSHFELILYCQVKWVQPIVVADANIYGCCTQKQINHGYVTSSDSLVQRCASFNVLQTLIALIIRTGLCSYSESFILEELK